MYRLILMEVQEVSRDEAILSFVRRHIAAVYDGIEDDFPDSVDPDYITAVAVLRGFFHGLGFAGLIPPTCEHQLCALSPRDFSKRLYRRMVITMLVHGFQAVRDAAYEDVDYLLAEAVGLTLPGAPGSSHE